MKTITKNTGPDKKLCDVNNSGVIVDPNMKDFSNDPYFVKKLEDAKRSYSRLRKKDFSK